MSNEKAIKNLMKEMDQTPHGIGYAIMRERMLSQAHLCLGMIEKEPEKWLNPIISVGMYKDYFQRVINHLEFK